jgi:hypothetical protein
MKHNEWKENLQLMIYDELPELQRKETEQHLQTCDSCRVEFEELKKLQQVLGPQAKLEPSEQLLMESRQLLRSALREEREKKSFFERLREKLYGGAPSYQVALGYCSAILIGLFVGYLAFGRPKVEHIAQQQKIPIDRGNVQISNVKFIDSNPGDDGQVEFAFDAVTPMKVKGSINDERIQKVLTYALVQEENPGVRLRAINAIEQSQVKPDPEIKKALITTLKSDENAGVRREALSLLQKFPFDKETKAAFLYVLGHDKNAALRIAVIQSLSAKKADDQEVRNVLKERVETDNNNFIRMKAKAVLQEVSNQ